jgi:hypothetical protein
MEPERQPVKLALRLRQPELRPRAQELRPLLWKLRPREPER